MKSVISTTAILMMCSLPMHAYASYSSQALESGAGAEGAAAWLSIPLIAVLLLFIGFAGTMLALLLSGFAISGLIGIVAFGLFFLGSYQAGFSNGYDGFFFVLGIVLLGLELFIPSFGILGILGALAVFRAVFMSFEDSGTALICMLAALVLAVTAVVLIAKRFKNRGIWNRFILRERLTSEEGFLPSASKDQLLGRMGSTITPLRPAGIVDIDGDRIDVVTSGEFISSNTSVKVIRVEGTRVIVKEWKV